MATADA
jgi:hypothetical protein